MEVDKPVLEGFLLFPPSGIILKKTWQKKYAALYKRSSSGVSRIEIYESEAKNSQAKIITLEDAVKIYLKSANLIHVLKHNSDVEFATIYEETLTNWLEALKSVAFTHGLGDNSIEQDNDLYCSTDEGVFCVKLHPSEASKKCNLPSKNYILVITQSALQLRDEYDNKLLYKWPFSYIRKYGYKDKKFTFEAGRKCASGEGIFYLEHPNHNEIYRCLSSKMKNMKKLLNGESSSSIIDSVDMQLEAVINMEAGSRNPLPPSVSVPESKKMSFGLSLASSLPSLETLTKPVPKKPPRKCLPSKNVSKLKSANFNLFNEFSKNEKDFEGGKYDFIENRTDAWKTMGIQEPPHSELRPENAYYSSWIPEQNSSETVLTDTNIFPNPLKHCIAKLNFGSSKELNGNPTPKKKSVNKNIEANCNTEDTFHSQSDLDSFGSLHVTKSVSKLSLTENKHAPTVITEPLTSDDESYDHLNFFGHYVEPTSSNYKDVLPPVSKQNNNFNPYVEVYNLKPARFADDSHLGYASIKKGWSSEVHKAAKDRPKEISAELTNDSSERVGHQFQNHQLYAVISKPKRV